MTTAGYCQQFLRSSPEMNIQHRTSMLQLGARGVTKLGDLIYVLCDPSFIKTFRIGTYEPSNDIDIIEINNPMDIVACPDSGRLYVAFGFTIWRINVTGVLSPTAEKWKSAESGVSFFTLSVTNRLLLVSHSSSSHIRQYDEYGQLVATFTAPSYATWTLHAVWTSRSTIIFGHWGTNGGVSEMTSNGSVIRTIQVEDIDVNGEQYRFLPLYITSVGDDYTRIIVCDSSQHGRILWIDYYQLAEDEPVKYRNVVGRQEWKFPYRVHYDRDNGRLYVIYEPSRQLSVFSLLL